MAQPRISILLLLAGALIAHGAHAADEVHWTIIGPTSVSFDWRGPETTLRYGLTTAYGSVVTAVAPTPLPFSSAGPFGEGRVTGLAAGTVYHYSIGTGPDHLFHTPPVRGGSNFMIFAEGDIGDDSDWPRMGVVQDMIAAGHPAFVLGVGDLTYGNPDGQSAVDRHFNDVTRWSFDAAYMPAWGNHEWDTPSNDDMRNYKGRFDLPNPQTSPSAPTKGCCGEDWSWFDYGNVRFIAYPEPYDGSTWNEWATKAGPLMDQAQGDPAIRFIVTYGHRPAYSSGHHPGESALRTVLDNFGATHNKYVLNLNGHSHDYERSHPQHGVTHLTVGVGGADLEQESGACPWYGGCPAPSWSAYRAMHHAAIQIRFSATSIMGTALCGPPGESGANLNDVSCTQGTIMDSFIIGATAGVGPFVSAMLLSVPYPNPSHGLVSFGLFLPGASRVEWGIYDVSGRKLGGGEGLQPQGSSVVSWNAAAGPSAMRGGMRFARITVGGQTYLRSFVML
jgi:hypothetical protein